ncbi:MULTISPECIES: HNH endonuclease, partial [Citrobacter]
ADRNRSHWSTSKTPSYTKSVSWQHHPHHIVPMSRQDAFDTSLDVEENIISLCCNCHKQIHLGQGYEDMLKEIYTARKRLLKKVGIDISLENLILYYKMESK